MKSLWEKVDHFGLGLHLEYKSLVPPRERDFPLMEEIIKGKPSKELSTSINRCRKRQEVIWMSGLASASSRIIEPHYYEDWRDSHEGTLGKHCSILPFGKEYPTKNDWKTIKKVYFRFVDPSTQAHLITGYFFTFYDY